MATPLPFARTQSHPPLCTTAGAASSTSTTCTAQWRPRRPPPQRSASAASAPSSSPAARSRGAGSTREAAGWGTTGRTWQDVKYGFVTVNFFALFGVSMVGADDCRFGGDSNEELCTRWIEVGALQSFSRNPNDLCSIPELYRWESTKEAAKVALGLRYRMLPFLYTLMYNAHNSGDLVSRHLWLNFPEDANTHSIDSQFMLGDSVLISPALRRAPRASTPTFPPASGTTSSRTPSARRFTSPLPSRR